MKHVHKPAGWLLLLLGAVISIAPARGGISSCISADSTPGCASIDQNFNDTGSLIGIEQIDIDQIGMDQLVATTSQGASILYHFSGTVNGPAGPGTLTGKFTTDASATSVLSFSFDLSNTHLPFSVDDAGGYVLTNIIGYVNVFSAGRYQFQNLGFSHQIVLNLAFNSLPGSINNTISSLLQAPNVSGADWDYIGSIPTGQASVPEPSSVLLIAVGLMMLALSRRTLQATHGLRRGSANLKIADEQSSDHPSGR
jgi:hypothetical protein